MDPCTLGWTHVDGRTPHYKYMQAKYMGRVGSFTPIVHIALAAGTLGYILEYSHLVHERKSFHPALLDTGWRCCWSYLSHGHNVVHFFFKFFFFSSSPPKRQRLSCFCIWTPDCTPFSNFLKLGSWLNRDARLDRCIQEPLNGGP